MRLKISKPQLVFIVAIFIPLLVVLIVLFVTTPRKGKIAVTIDVVPSDSQITINDKSSHKGTVWLDPGKYTFIAKKDGFSEAKTTVLISKTNNYIALKPTAVSEDAKKWVSDHGYELDGLGTRAFEESSKQIVESAPLVSKLPYTTDDFKISYNFSKADSSSVYIIITGADADGRTKALQWIKDSGYDPADYTFVFEGQSSAPGSKEESDI